MNHKKIVVPKSAAKYFWGDDLKELSWTEHQDYIIQTILEKGDRATIRWLFSQIDKKRLKSKLPQFKLTPKSKNFWSIYLS